MIVSKIKGGLGNQFFQYAIGRSLANKHQTKLKLDISFYEKQKKREYLLDLYSLNAEKVNSLESKFYITKDHAKLSNTQLEKSINRIGILPILEYKEEQQFHFDLDFQNYSDNLYLNGYWQSEKYFYSIRNKLIKELTLIKPPSKINQAKLQKIIKSQSVSIHIRRGDIVTDTNINKIYHLCDLEYYLTCVKNISKHINQPHFFVFSDDIEWAKENLNIKHPVLFVDNNKNSPEEDFRLIKHCKHHIIANSSFSWWGAWLSETPQKRIYAPKKWFKLGQYNVKDLIPDSWIRI